MRGKYEGRRGRTYQTALIGVFDQRVLSAATCQIARDVLERHALQRTDLRDAVAELIEIDQAGVVRIERLGDPGELLERRSTVDGATGKAAALTSASE